VSFYPLPEVVSRSGLEELDVAALTEHLLQRSKERGETVTLLGATVPSYQLTTWGTVAVFGVHFYFLCLLSQLRSTLRASHALPLVGYPWIAIYRDMPSRVLSILMASGLPASVYILALASLAAPGLETGVVLRIIIPTVFGLILSLATCRALIQITSASSPPGSRYVDA
jgi:hypothetical protein